MKTITYNGVEYPYTLNRKNAMEIFRLLHEKDPASVIDYVSEHCVQGIEDNDDNGTLFINVAKLIMEAFGNEIADQDELKKKPENSQ